MRWRSRQYGINAPGKMWRVSITRLIGNICARWKPSSASLAACQQIKSSLAAVQKDEASHQPQYEK
jgi:hypothetical protein